MGDAIKAGLGWAPCPVFMLAGEPSLVPLGDTLTDCESDLWLLAHAESRHLRRIAVVYDHFAASVPGLELLGYSKLKTTGPRRKS